jgi:predicted transcriptional regulator
MIQVPVLYYGYPYYRWDVAREILRRQAVELSRPLSTVTPTLDGDVLAVLARHDVTFTTGQLHRVLTHYSEEGIRKVLQRLTRQGIVQSERVGNAFSYRLNRDHLAAEHIIGLAGLRETFLNRLEDRLQSWEVPPVYAAVFGSAARGSMTVDSDVDLLLVRPDDAPDDLWAAQVDDLVSDVTRWVGNDTRPLQFTAGELAARAGDEPVLRDVLNEGLTVAGTRAWLNKQLRKGKG